MAPKYLRVCFIKNKWRQRICLFAILEKVTCNLIRYVDHLFEIEMVLHLNIDYNHESLTHLK